MKSDLSAHLSMSHIRCGYESAKGKKAITNIIPSARDETLVFNIRPETSFFNKLVVKGSLGTS